MRFQAGDRCCFLGYSNLPKGADPIFFQGDIIAVAKVEPDDVLLCFPIDGWGRVFSWQGETVFAEEVIRLPLPPIPMRRFPRPYGEGDNEGASWKSEDVPPRSVWR